MEFRDFVPQCNVLAFHTFFAGIYFSLVNSAFVRALCHSEFRFSLPFFLVFSVTSLRDVAANVSGREGQHAGEQRLGGGAWVEGRPSTSGCHQHESEAGYRTRGMEDSLSDFYCVVENTLEISLT